MPGFLFAQSIPSASPPQIAAVLWGAPAEHCGVIFLPCFFPGSASCPNPALIKSFPKNHTQSQFGESVDRKVWISATPLLPIISPPHTHTHHC